MENLGEEENTTEKKRSESKNKKRFAHSLFRIGKELAVEDFLTKR